MTVLAEWASDTGAVARFQVRDERAAATLVLVYSESGGSGTDSLPLDEAFAEWADESLDLAGASWTAVAESWPSY
jgi:hypothetical protein